MWWKQYEPILEQKPRPAFDVLKEILAKELVEALLAFPPSEEEFEWSDERMRKKYQGRIAELPEVSIAFIELLCKLLRWDLGHETDAIDHLFRNELHFKTCPNANEQDALHLLWRGTLEHLYSRKEELADAHLKTKDLLDIIDVVEERFGKTKLQIV
ncbi:MAG: hypothetical protein GY822_09445 [Deltaproteobacteria bacterium]|nr:hypothetical protein [Deltaproteobacteria bacterium]